MKKILVDMDMVIANFLFALLSRIKEEWNIEIDLEDIKPTPDVLPVLWKMGVEDLTHEDIWSLLDNGKIFEDLPVIEGALEGFRKLKENNWDIFIVTNIPRLVHLSPYIFDAKIKWLEKEGFFSIIDLNKVIFARQKNMVKGDILIDDSPHNINSFDNKVIIYDQPWNRHITNRMRAYNWDDIIRLTCERLSNEE